MCFGLGKRAVGRGTVAGGALVPLKFIQCQTGAINTGNEWRTEEPLKEEVTGL